MPSLYHHPEKQFEVLLESIQNGIELCSSIKQWKKKKRKLPWFNNKVERGITKKKQALKRFRKKPTASNKTRILRIELVKKHFLLLKKPNVIIFQMSFQFV